MDLLPPAIAALTPRGGAGHQFVCYADSCSGVAGEPEEAKFARVNAVLARLRPQPQFVCFPGDEIIGLSNDEETLRNQWRYWFEREMRWLDRTKIPLFHTTGNHTAYDPASERVFGEILAHLPRNGPPGQEGMTYFVRRDDLLLVFVNTLWSGHGGEGRVETTWLDQTLSDHADARHRLVFGHHPAHPVRGHFGPHELGIVPEDGREFWEVLRQHRVSAYLCSHLLTFDVQVHQGVLQVVTGGAGRTRGTLHCVQAALDSNGLRYQVLDTSGGIKAWLEWPPHLPPSESWMPFGPSTELQKLRYEIEGSDSGEFMIAWCLSGIIGPCRDGEAQTLISGWDDCPVPAPVWIGLLGREHRVAVLLSKAPGRSPSYWLGPSLPPNEPFTVQLAFHTGMGPGGVLWRKDDRDPWSTLPSASSHGLERLTWPSYWSTGHGQRGTTDRPFRGLELKVTWHVQAQQLDL